MKKNNFKNILFYKKNLPLTKVIESINNSTSKTVFVVNKNMILLGSITDGDIRRYIIKFNKFEGLIDEVINKNPIFIKNNKKKLSNIIDFLDIHQIKSVPILDDGNKIIDIFSSNAKKNQNKKIYKNMNKVSVVIMAGGKGKRLKPLSNILPKPLIPIQNEPIINIIIKEFENYKIKNFIISINEKLDIVKTYLESNFKKKPIKYLIEKKPLGTIGSISLINKISKDFFVTNCDTIIKYNYNNIYNFHKKEKNMITIVCATIDSISPYGECVIDKNNNLLNLIEKPKRKILAMTGLYVFNKEIIKMIPSNKKIDMNSLLLKLIKLKFKIGTFKIDNKNWTDVGNWEKYKQVSEKSKFE